MAGRPTDYSEEVAEIVCDRLIMGESLIAICRDETMPAEKSIYNWLQTHSEFLQKYTVARSLQADRFAEEIVDISDDGTNDWMERQSSSEKGAGVNTGWVLNGEHVQRSRLRVEARKWAASKMAPKKYGDKLDTTVSGPDGGPVHTITEIKRTIVDPKAIG